MSGAKGHALARHAPLPKCLSVRDPWIKLLGPGARGREPVKGVEIRKRNTHYRGDVVLCSSLRIDKGDVAERARRVHAYAFDAPLPLGHALFIARLVSCFPARPAHAKGACVPSKLLEAEGLWAWMFVDVRRFEPFPISGLLGLFEPPADLVRYLRRATVE